MEARKSVTKNLKDLGFRFPFSFSPFHQFARTFALSHFLLFFEVAFSIFKQGEKRHGLAFKEVLDPHGYV